MKKVMIMKNNKTMQIDRQIKNLWINALSKNSGYTVIDTDTINTDGYSPIDIIATKCNTKYIIELKGRNFESTKYSDNSISKHKIQRMKEIMKNDKTITSGFTISVFSDGVSFVNSIEDEGDEFERMIKHTTYFDNQNVEINTMVSYQPRWVYTKKQLLTD